MGENITFEQRLSYYQIGESRRAVLKEFQPQLMKKVPKILNDFYNFITVHPVSKDKFSGMALEGVKRLQLEHWQTLFAGNFDEEYAQRSIEIGQIHERIGITPFLYMGGYTFILNQLTDFVIESCGGNRKKCQTLIRALNAAVMMDMELALTSYAEASNASKAMESANHFADQMLDKNVSLSMAVNEVAVENAGMMTSLENVNSQAQSIAAAVEEMATGIATISANGEEVAQGAENAQNETQQGKQVIEETAHNMHRVAQAVTQSSERVSSLVATSEDIANMVLSIEKIASQTNLLALNATIEAARAGEAGKGFAVVANEVKNLANQTARATDDIRTTIESLTVEIDGIVVSMKDGAQAVSDGEISMKSAVNSMEAIGGAIELTSQRMMEISSILNEQEQVATEVSGNVSAIAAGTEQNVNAISVSIGATDGVVQLISEQIMSLSEFDVPKKSIRIAKSDHIVWKKRLADMMVGRESLDPDELASHLSCRLGKWYYGDEGMKLKDTATYRELEGPHKVVHDCGIEAVRKFNAGDKDGALVLLEQVNIASKDVVRLLDELISS